MELTAFLVRVPRYPEPERTLLWSTRTGAFAVVSDAELEALERLPHEDGAFSPLCEGLLDPDVAIVVPSRADEEREFRAWYGAKREATAVLSIAVSTSFACNFACTYCYQDAYLAGDVMKPATADAFASWCEARLRETGAERLRYTVLGGEPLLHPELVVRLATNATRVAEAAGATFAFTLITNGYFLTPELVDRLVPLGLEQVQITLDGDEATHGHTRPTKKRENPFRTIWQNLIAIRGRVPVVLAGNYTPDTVGDFPKLLERMKDAGLTPDEIKRVTWKPALETADSPGGGACGGSWAEANGAALVGLLDQVREAGYVPRDLLDLGPCGIHNINHFAVDPAGLIFECPGFVGHSDWAIGDVSSGIDPARRARSRPADPMEGCGSCGWRGRCAGGCLAIRWVNEGRATGLSCEAGYFDRVAEAGVKREWVTAMPDGVERGEAFAALAAESAEAHRGAPRRVRLPIVR